MKICHGPIWPREVHAPTSWICPFCGKGAVAFERPDDLALHLEGSHPNILTEPQVQAIVRQSRFHYPRAPDICPLCSFSVSQPQDRKLKSVDQGGRASTAVGQTKHTTSNHEQTREQSALGSKAESSAETATHMVAHLRDIMLLSLRLIPAHLKTRDSEDTQSRGSSQYSVSSIIRSGQGDPGPVAASDDGLADESSSCVVSDDRNQEYDFSTHIEPPDVLHKLDWDTMLRPNFQSENVRQEAGVGQLEPASVDSQEFRSYKSRFSPSALESSLRTLRGHTASVELVVFSPDSQHLASGSRDETIKIWNVATGQCLQAWKGHTDWVYSVAFSPDGQRLASGSTDETIRVWNVTTGQCLQTWEGHTDTVFSVAFSPDG